LTFDLDLQTRPSEGSNIFRVNLVQIRSAVPEIFHTQIKKVTVPKQNLTQFTACSKKPQTDGAKNRTFRSLVRAVMIAVLHPAVQNNVQQL